MGLESQISVHILVCVHIGIFITLHGLHGTAVMGRDILHDVPLQAFIIVLTVLHPQCPGHFRHKAGRIGVVEGGHQVGGSFLSQGQPVPEATMGSNILKGSLLENVVVPCPAGTEVHEGFHTLPVLVKHAGIAVGLVQLVRTDDPCFHPSGGEVIAGSDKGCGRKIGIGPGFPLVIVQIPDPLGEKGGHIPVDGSRFHIHLRITGPA